MSEVKLVLLHSFTSLHEANIAQSFLRSRDIEATIFDEHTVNIYATPSIFSGVRLMVPSHQVELAKAELKSQKEFALTNTNDVQGDSCPKCSSTNTEITNINRKDFLWLLLSFLVVFPMFKESTREWVCHSCGNKWKSKSSSFENQTLHVLIRILVFAFIATMAYYYAKKYI